MKKTSNIISALLLISLVSMVSCTKLYHCSCTYNNAVTYNEQLGNMTKQDAINKCNTFDTLKRGEIWTCTIY